MDGGAFDLDSSLRRGGKTVGFLVRAIFLITDADRRGLQKTDHRGQGTFARQPGAFRSFCTLRAELGQSLPEGQHPGRTWTGCSCADQLG